MALESTIISHGMPFPQNLETALQARSLTCLPSKLQVVFLHPFADMEA